MKDTRGTTGRANLIKYHKTDRVNDRMKDRSNFDENSNKSHQLRSRIHSELNSLIKCTRETLEEGYILPYQDRVSSDKTWWDSVSRRKPRTRRWRNGIVKSGYR